MNIQFLWPWLLTALPLPLLVAWLWPRSAAQPEPALSVPYPELLTTLGTPRPVTAGPTRRLLAVLAWVLLVLAAARPAQVGDALQLPVSGRDLMLAVDISGSMETTDMTLRKQPVDRLTAVKALAGDFIEQRASDRLGLILFGDQAYLQTPLTFDRETVATQLGEAAIGLAGTRTAIGDAIGLAVKHLRDQPQENRVLILLTDGENTAGGVAPLKAAELASREHVRIYTIGIGADEQVVQSIFGRQRVANTELDETTLKAIAETTGGRYFRARNSSELQQIYQLLDAIEPVSSDQQTFRPVAERYYWPLGIALLITLLLAVQQTGVLRKMRVREVQHA